MAQDAALQALQAVLDQYDRTILLPGAEDAGLLDQLLESDALRHTEKRVLILFTGERERAGKGGAVCKRLDREDCGKLRRLYHLYEFSDRFQILSRDRHFGGLFNLADAGLLNMEELFAALLA